jgi:XTP/dITP diphosphohydrolase
MVGRTSGMGESQEELEELQVEVSAGDQDKMEARVWRCLFSMINYADFKINPGCFERTNKKFIKRFQYFRK